MEYVIVTYPTDRLVYIDEEQCGRTNELQRIDAGTHLFALGNLDNFQPASQTLLVQGTTRQQPMQVAFLPKEA